LHYEEAIALLRSQSDPKNVEGMRRFGISTKTALGLRKPQMEAVAKKIGRDHKLAQRLWDSGIREARHVAAMIDDPMLVTEDQMERWVKDFDSWDVCDDCCGALFDKTPFAYREAAEWSERDEEFVKRAGFAMMAELAVHDKTAEDEKFLQFLPIIKVGALDERNFVKKAVNWALRQIGKRNLPLNRRAIAMAEDIARLDSRSARWIAADALRELKGEAVQKRLRRL
jgi:3-methyladenine DNA glycosylase AlkD